jgi:hypothetical protein
VILALLLKKRKKLAENQGLDALETGEATIEDEDLVRYVSEYGMSDKENNGGDEVPHAAARMQDGLV